MISKFKNIDAFGRNILIVLSGTSIANFLNLLYQLLVAHSFSPSDFAAFNSLLSIYTLIAAPLGTLQAAAAKYGAQYNARNEHGKFRRLFAALLKTTSFFALVTFIIFLLISGRIMAWLKIASAAPVLIFAVLLAAAWVMPVISGGIQGLELFGRLSSLSVLSGIAKLALAVLFILAGFSIAGAMGALLASALLFMALGFWPLRRMLAPQAPEETIDYKEILTYLLPVGVSLFCFNALSGFDIVLVRWLFGLEDSGFYSLAQMVGKIFLFLPAAISIVMFPRTSGLSAQNMDTTITLRRSLKYVLLLSVTALCFYNIFPSFVLKVLTGKNYPESIFLGRLFSVSMSLFAVLFIFINYFLSIKDLRFVKYLAAFTLLQNGAVYLFHPSLTAVQLIVCFSAAVLCLIHTILAFR